MRVEEAKAIAGLVQSLAVGKGAVCLNVGSSTQHFREVVQPHVTWALMRPIEAAGVRIIHCDIKPDRGVDLVGDVLDAGFQSSMAARNADLLLCCNLLEHLPDPAPFAAACGTIVKPGGFIIVSVPLSYPYHPDPIDTMYRPTPEDLCALFPGWKVVTKQIVESETFLEETLRKKGGGAALARHIAKVLLPLYRPRQWWPNAHRLTWLFRSYKSSVIVMEKPAREDRTARVA